VRTIKPLRLALLPRCYENGGRCHLAVSIAFFFPFEPSDVLLPEMSMWKLIAEEMGTGMPIDECMPKRHPELLVFGSAFARGAPQPVVRVRVQLGAIDKSLVVLGDRHWEKGGVPSDPTPFASLPVDWAHAFGGAGFARNPLGKGVAPSDAKNADHPLPNVEALDRRITARGDRPEPAGLCNYPLDWPQRTAKAGTYDEKWLKELFPGFAADMDPTFFNVAPPDQWSREALRGDEPFAVENMHPEHARVAGRLPGLRARCFVNQRTDAGLVFREIDTRLDTVMLFPHRMRGIMFWRGSLPIAEDDAADIEQIVGAAERRDAPRPAAHYQRAMQERSDEKTRHLYALKDSDLLPAECMRPSGLGDDKLTDVDDLLAREGLLEKNMHKRIELVLEEAREKVRAAGFDPVDKGIPAEAPPPFKPPSLEEMPEFHAKMTAEFERMQKDVEEKRDQQIKEVRAKCAKLGIDYDQKVAQGRREQAGPPKFRAAVEVATIREKLVLANNAGVPLPELAAKLADPEFERKLQHAEQMLFDSYRKHAHFQPAAAALGDAESAAARARVLADRAAGRSLRRVDLTGANLAGMDLRSLDLREALMEAVDLSGADLAGANLTGACLARANLSRAALGGAIFRDANLAQARFEGVSGAEGVDFSNASLYGADLSGADLSGAMLGGATLLELIVKDTTLARIRGEKLIFMKIALGSTSFAGANMPGSVFLECALDGADFSKAMLRDVAFVASSAKKARFRGADVSKLRAVKESDFEGADFAEVTAERANFRGCKLSRATFERARLDRSDLSSCDAQGASFEGASLVESLLIRTDLRGAKLGRANLMMALLQKAKIRGADFTSANLFRADFTRIDGDRATKFDRANMNQIRFVRRSGGVV
jgi:uncharacterized protein YjbI with pentapeptide repeats